MIYIVSGFMRSGTSMMMHALANGGLTPCYNKDRNSIANSKSDDFYHPNKNGLYELDVQDHDFQNYHTKYSNKLIKLMVWGLPHLIGNDYKIVLMKRDKEEIRQSFEAFFDRPLKNVFFKNYDTNMAQIIALLDSKKIDYMVYNYRNVVDYPIEYFKALYDRGWPIDYLSSANTVDKAQCRFKLELLTVGI